MTLFRSPLLLFVFIRACFNMVYSCSYILFVFCFQCFQCFQCASSLRPVAKVWYIQQKCKRLSGQLYEFNFIDLSFFHTSALCMTCSIHFKNINSFSFALFGPLHCTSRFFSTTAPCFLQDSYRNFLGKSKLTTKSTNATWTQTYTVWRTIKRFFTATPKK